LGYGYFGEGLTRFGAGFLEEKLMEILPKHGVVTMTAAAYLMLLLALGEFRCTPKIMQVLESAGYD